MTKIILEHEKNLIQKQIDLLTRKKTFLETFMLEYGSEITVEQAQNFISWINHEPNLTYLEILERIDLNH